MDPSTEPAELVLVSGTVSEVGFAEILKSPAETEGCNDWAPAISLVSAPRGLVSGGIFKECAAAMPAKHNSPPSRKNVRKVMIDESRMA
jgi:hypothetical protein